ncbi:MAG TPA: GspE/PulE family protein [bacterium]|nr:GspE/PulE family protein [bacterium]
MSVFDTEFDPTMLDEPESAQFRLTSVEKYLVQNGFIDLGTLRVHQVRAMERGVNIEEQLLDADAVPESAVLAFKSEKLGVEYVDLEAMEVDPAVAILLSQEFCLTHRCFPINVEGTNLALAMVEPGNRHTRDLVQGMVGKRVIPYLATRGSIAKKLFEYSAHFRRRQIDHLLTTVENQDTQLSRKLGLEISSIRDVATQAPVVKTLNLLILQALQMAATDIHLEPTREHLRVRFRIDGVLQNMKPIPLERSEQLISRIKILCEMNIAERRLPQDGHFQIKIEGEEIDFRVVITPMVNGEKAVLRILNRHNVVLDLKYLGFDQALLDGFRKHINKPNGIVVITGPTGSGKTTTLYSALRALNYVEKNITTVENPVEYHMDEVTQIQVNPDIGLTFGAVLRSVLRQDPDILLIGEIRDLETAKIAIQASQTGHLVFATLHTNDAAGAVTRLLDLGAEPYLLASTIRCVMSQRLVRKVCRFCKTEFEPDQGYLDQHGIALEPPYRHLAFGRGCQHCFGSGYAGRTAVGELMNLTDALSDLIMARSNARALRQQAVADGMVPLATTALKLAYEQVTTLEEVLVHAEIL